MKEANASPKDAALRLALEALELVSIEFVCNGAHHAKKDRHEWLDPCPIVDRYKEAITAIKAALANEALERKAENAKELGLDYEPLETPKEKYIYGTPLLDAMTKEKK